jgi:fructose-bisphosphate aldolase class II
MPLGTTRDIVAAAAAQGRGVGAFNVITVEHAEAVVTGAEAAGSPVVLQISENAVVFHGGDPYPIAAAAAAVARRAAVPVSLHLDHVEDDDLARSAVAAGFSSLMYDASRRSEAENVASTRAVAEWAHARGVWVEAELGEIGGKDGAHAPGARTDPGEAERFVAQTGVDALAVAVGSSHAMVSQTARLDHDLIATLGKRVPVPLVLHGSSGVSHPELRRAISSGIVKVNVGTALNVAFTNSVRATLAARPEVVDPRTYLRGARASMAETVEHILSQAICPAEHGS